MTGQFLVNDCSTLTLQKVPLPASFHPAVVIILTVLLTGCAPELGDSDAALALEDIASGHNPSRLKAKTLSPARSTVNYTIDGRHNFADLYLSPQGARAGIVLIPGVVADGKDDHRLVALANTLARLRFAVLVPEIAGLRRFHTRASDVRVMADAFRYLISQPALAPEGRAGFAGFSYGVGVVLLAALEPDIRKQVQFLMGFGGYHDIRSMVIYFTTGYYRDEVTGKFKYSQPHYYLKWVFTLSNADLLQRAEDRAALRALADAYGEEEDLETELSRLAPDARALYQLISNENPNRVAALIDKLSARMRKEMDGINPARRDLSQIRARVILLHGRGDTMIPYTESIAIAKALPAEQVTLFLIEGYAHTDIKPKRKDLPQILGAMELLMQQRVEEKQ